MLFDLPSDDILYASLLARDAAYDGRAYVGVSSTGVFCRLTCPARKPKRENCSFFAQAGDCVAAGFRPCKRCDPLFTAAQNDPILLRPLRALEDNPSHCWSEGDVIAIGLDPSTVRRSFKRHFGMTFLEMARQRRLAQGFTTLRDSKVIDAQLDAGFESASAFRTAIAKILGVTPQAFRSDAMLRAEYLDTPLGTMIAVGDKNALHLLEFADRRALPAELNRLRQQVKGSIGVGRYPTTDQVEEELNNYFAGQSDQFETPLVMHGTPFTKQVWTALRTVPAGETRTYGALAKQIGAPQSTRAVARANGANQIAILIPCHRIIGADGALTGYGGGLWRKQQLIDLERHYATQRG